MLKTVSFKGGFTWHILVGLLVFSFFWALASWIKQLYYNRQFTTCFNDLGYSFSPLFGVWIAVIWETLPIAIIHPPMKAETAHHYELFAMMYHCGELEG